MTTNAHILTINDHLNTVRFLVRQLPDSTDKQAIITLLDHSLDHLLEANTDLTNSNRKISELVDRVATLSRSIYEPVVSAQYAYPAEDDYNAVREYVEQRKANDEVFKRYVQTHSRKQLCDRLTDEFGWAVDVRSYSRNVQRH